MANQTSRTLPKTDYTVACICPMGIELAPVEAMLDEIHEHLPSTGVACQNAYTLGSVGEHNVVVAVMPVIGNNAAAMVATQLLHDFPSIFFALLIGIGGGIPSSDADIRLGDVVVSQPSKAFGGVVQYDIGKKVTGGCFERTGQLNAPPPILSSHVRKLEGRHLREGSRIWKYLTEMVERYPMMKATYSRPHARDLLFVSSYLHQAGKVCESCDPNQVVARTARTDDEPRVHYGTIGSANVVIKDAVVRDQLKEDLDILCVDMEAAGLMNNLPSLVVRGICDYADSHKNNTWQCYAAATAAAYCKELLMVIPAQQVIANYSLDKRSVSASNKIYYFGGAPEIEPSLFVGRCDELKRMYDFMQSGSAGRTQLRLALGGMGGVGKTQLAITFAKRYQDHYSSICWFNASSEAALIGDILSFAQYFNTFSSTGPHKEQQAIQHVLNWFVQHSNWLIIFDNYDELWTFDLKKYYPRSLHGNLIITTRFADYISAFKIVLHPLESVKESLQVLALRCEQNNVTKDSDARRLAERLHGLPLALATVGSYLRRCTWSFAQYHREYNKIWNIDPQRPYQLKEYENRTLYTTWDLSYKRLEEMDPEAARILKLLAYVGNKRISCTLFGSASQQKHQPMLTILADRNRFESVMRILAEYCFVEAQPDTQSYSMHACVHNWTLATLNETVDVECYWEIFDSVIEHIPRDLRRTQFLKHVWLAPHAERLTHERFMSGCWSNVPIARCENAIDLLAKLLGHQDLCDSAIVLVYRVLAEFEYQLGPNDPRTLKVQRHLGDLYWHQGKLGEAESQYARSLAKAEHHLGTEHEITIDIVSSFAKLNHVRGRAAEAESWYLRAIDANVKLHGLENDKTIANIGNLGRLYLVHSRLHEARSMLEWALALSEKHFGPEGVTTLGIVEDIGHVSAQQGKHAEAEAMFSRAVAGLQAAYGPLHPEVFWTRTELGHLYVAMDRLQDARRILHCLLTAEVSMLGCRHVRLRPPAELANEIQLRELTYVDRTESRSSKALLPLTPASPKDSLTPKPPTFNIDLSKSMLDSDREPKPRPPPKVPPKLEEFSPIPGLD